jgi:nitroreductase
MTQRAPSSFNTQPWVAIVVTSEQRKAALAAAMLGDNGSKVCVSACVCACLRQRNPNL